MKPYNVYIDDQKRIHAQLFCLDDDATITALVKSGPILGFGFDNVAAVIDAVGRNQELRIIGAYYEVDGARVEVGKDGQLLITGYDPKARDITPNDEFRDAKLPAAQLLLMLKS